LSDRALFEKRCSKCHDLDRIYATKVPPKTWQTIVQTMQLKPFNGISNAEAKRITAYLAQTQTP
jgi:hypothetical protein